MAPGKKTRLSQKEKVIAAKISDPELSLRDIEKQTGIKKDTVGRTIKEIPEIYATSGDKGVKIMEAIDEIIENSTEIARKHLKVLRDKTDISTRDVKTVTEIHESYFKKKQLLEGKPTEINSTKIDLTSMTPKQLEELKKQYL